MTPETITEQINIILLQRLQRAGCITGRLTCEVPGTNAIITLHGYKPGADKPIFFWQWEPPFTTLVWAYLESFQPVLRVFSVEIDAAKGKCHYYNTNAPAYKKQQQTNARQQAKEERDKKEEHKKYLAAQTQLYGNSLSAAVAKKLLGGARLGYSHRDYCGTGLQYRNGQFEYVELWDYAVNLLQAFATEKEFTQWLGRQSDASLGMLDATSSFYWGNQTITRKRLEAFVAGKGDV